MSAPDAHGALVRTLSDAIGPLDALTAKTREWWSATFQGTRHALRFTVPWTRERVIAVIDLPEANMPMAGHFVADLRVILAERRGDTLHVELEALTIVEA
jgi:hypothetical protein